MFKFTFIFFLFLSKYSFAQVTSAESLQAATTLGKWIAQATSHYDFYSATPVSTPRAGVKFFTRGESPIQMASEYGYSSRRFARTDPATQAYQTLGFDTSTLSSTMDINRYHINLGFSNATDINFSYLKSALGITGWGCAYKTILEQDGSFYYSFRTQYSESSLASFFQTKVLANDLSISYHFRLIDFFAGVRHNIGWINFESTTPDLKIPEITYIADTSELEYFLGVVIATTYNSRMTLQANKTDSEYTYTAKLSLHFDSLLPTINNWFKDPRSIRR